MADTIKVVDSSTGQIEERPIEDVVVVDVQDELMFADLPPEFDHIIRIPASNGMKRVAAISHATLLNDAMVPILAHETLIDGQIAALQAHDVVLDNMDAQLAAHDVALDGLVANKFDKPTGTTAQYIRGDGSLATLPSPVDISGKSDKSQFSATSSATAHGQTAGQTNGVTSNPTNAPADSRTDYGVLAAILGADVNSANSKQNATATNVNTIATNLNALATKYNELATKFNALINWLGTTTTTGLTGNVNALRLAGAT
jgi:hypothetical protein